LEGARESALEGALEGARVGALEGARVGVREETRGFECFIGPVSFTGTKGADCSARSVSPWSTFSSRFAPRIPALETVVARTRRRRRPSRAEAAWPRSIIMAMACIVVVTVRIKAGCDNQDTQCRPQQTAPPSCCLDCVAKRHGGETLVDGWTCPLRCRLMCSQSFHSLISGVSPSAGGKTAANQAFGPCGGLM